MKIRSFLLACLAFAISSIHALGLNWQTLAPGMEYAHLTDFPGFPDGGLQVFRIDPAHYRFQSVNLNSGSDNAASVQEAMQKNKALIAINGGFFSPDYKSLGLRISDGQQTNAFKSTNWWGIFLVQGGKPEIIAAKAYHADLKADFAIQAGPRLVVNGHIPKLAPTTDFRTALGITNKGKVVLVATDGLLLSTSELATRMQKSESEGGLACTDALNLDGGHSTQLYAHIADFNLVVNSYTPVADAVLVVGK